MATNGETSFFARILEFFKKLFGGKKGQPETGASGSGGTNTGGDATSSSGNGDSGAGGTSTSSGQGGAGDNAKLDEVKLKYGEGEISLSKSKKYFAIKQDRDSNMPAAVMRTATPVPIPAESVKTVGHFELVEPTAEHGGANLDETLDNVRSLPTVDIGTHVFHAAEGDETPLIPSGEIYVKFAANASWDDCLNLLHEMHLSIIEKRAQGEVIVQCTPSSKNPIKCSLELQQSPLVEVAEPELESPMKFENFRMPSDSLLGEQWHLRNTGSHGNWPANTFKVGADAKVVDAWEQMRSLGSPNIVVAVIDSGFDLDHPDLRGNGNKIVHPWDFETDTPNPTPRMGDWHGTPCAGVAIGDANGTGIVGAAPGCKFMPLRSSWISDSQIEKWFNYCVENGADVVSNSWGSASPDFVMSTRMFNAIRNCVRNGRNGIGTVVVFAAGNSNRRITNPSNPSLAMGFATHPDVITVAASNSKDERSSYSNYGKEISVCAPSNGTGGAGITTADVGGTIPLPSGAMGFKGYDEGDITTSFGGTSSACPLVAGICALLLSVKSGLTPAQVKQTLQTTTDKIGSGYDSSGHSEYFGYGRINALKAVKKAQGQSVPIDVPTPTPVDPDPVTPTPPPVDPVTPTPVDPPVNEDDVIALPFEGLRGGAMASGGIEHLYKISLNQKLRVKMESPVGDTDKDFDLYVRKDAIPVPQSRQYDAASTSMGANEDLVIDRPALGSYYILLQSHKGSGGYNLEATLEASSSDPNVEALPLQALTGGVLIKDRMASVVYRVRNHKKLEVSLESPVGNNPDFDLYIKRGGIPRWNDNDGKSTGSGASERVVINQPDAGDFYILIRSQSGAGGYNLKVSLT